MLRRVVSLLLLPCVLLAQTAVLGHAHGGIQPAGHDLRPHFHLTLSSASGHEVHGYHHHDDDDDDGAPEAGKQPTSEPEPLSDHDADAVFIPSVDAVLGNRPVLDNELTGWSFLAVSELNLVAAIWAERSSGLVHWAHPPPLVHCPCPLYIRHLALLI